jgi:hypothetical protein
LDPTEIRFIRQAFIKERGAEVFRKIRQLIANAGMKFIAL